MLKLQYFGHLIQRADSLEKTLMLGKIEGRRRCTEDEMVGWHHWLNGHKFEQALGDGEGQGSLPCCSPWGRKVSDTTEQLNNSSSKMDLEIYLSELGQRKTNITWCHLYVQSLKKCYKWVYLQQKQTQTYRTNLRLYQEGRIQRGRDRLGGWDWHVRTAIFKICNQEEPSIQHRELFSVLWAIT